MDFRSSSGGRDSPVDVLALESVQREERRQFSKVTLRFRSRELEQYYRSSHASVMAKKFSRVLVVAMFYQIVLAVQDYMDIQYTCQIHCAMNNI